MNVFNHGCLFCCMVVCFNHNHGFNHASNSTLTVLEIADNAFCAKVFYV